MPPNSNIAFDQHGATRQANMLLGSMEDQLTTHKWQELQWLMMGNSTPERIGKFDHFLGDLLEDEWATNLSTGATIAINAQAGGAIRFTTDTDDDDHATLALSLSWLVSSGDIVFAARVKSVSAITLRAIEVGLSDALSETNGLAFSDHSAAGVTAVATDAVMFGYDTDASMTTWAALSVNGGGTPQATTLAAAPSLTYQKLGIWIRPTGEARFFVNDVLVATHALAVATTALLTPWISLKSLSGAAKSIDADYVGIGGSVV